MRTIYLLLLIIALSGCRAHRGTQPARPARPQQDEREVAAGVRYRHVAAGSALSPGSDVFLVDVDLGAPAVHAAVCSGEAVVEGGRVMAESLSVRDWCGRRGALAAINGGFFGITKGARKEVIGLLASDGGIISSGRVVRSPSHADRRLVRCVLGFDVGGLPHVGWAVGERARSALLTEYTRPLNPGSQRYWSAARAVACGPRLIELGREHVTDREERLASPPPLPRTFAAYSQEGGRPRRLLLAVAPAMTFRDAASFLQRYFRQYHACSCAEAMCLDGGASSQLAVANGSALDLPYGAEVAVPDAILIFAPPASR